MGLFQNLDLRKAAVSFLFLSGFAVAGGFVLSFVCGTYTIAISISFAVLYFVLMKQREKKIQDMVLIIDRILHGEELFDFAEFKEGELAILRDEIYKMTLRLKGQAEQLNTDKKFLADSLANISHQLKTPLTALNLLTERLRGYVLEGEGRQCLKKMQEQLKRTEWLVTMLLKLSRLDAKTILFRKERRNIKQLVQMAAEPLLIPMELKGQTIQIHSGLEEFCLDTIWTAEAIGNILKNCMEHAPCNTIIEVYVKENPLYLELRIEDSGEGVSEEELSHLFERFYRGKNASAFSAGIGLALAKAIIVSQHGSISAKNKTDKGMCFLVRFYKGVV